MRLSEMNDDDRIFTKKRIMELCELDRIWVSVGWVLRFPPSVVFGDELMGDLHFSIEWEWVD